jgi:hypothetical protein
MRAQGQNIIQVEDVGRHVKGIHILAFPQGVQPGLQRIFVRQSTTIIAT